ncbi:MAG TPA: hypothetical protein VIU42_15710 [Xanthobacteraceae bacterium]|jgi:hypothetical protein
MAKLACLLTAAAIVAFASTSAHAKYQVIRWTSGFCQVWNHSIPGKPFPSDWKASKEVHKTFREALNQKRELVARRQCW